MPSLYVNEFLFLERAGEAPFHAIVREIQGKSAQLATLKDYSHQKNNVWGIVARNREQNFALNLLMDPECDFISLIGQAKPFKPTMPMEIILELYRCDYADQAVRPGTERLDAQANGRRGSTFISVLEVDIHST